MSSPRVIDASNYPTTDKLWEEIGKAFKSSDYVVIKKDKTVLSIAVSPSAINAMVKDQAATALQQL